MKSPGKQSIAADNADKAGSQVVNEPVERPLRRVLIANRGELAARIVRACREAGLESVAVYSRADENAAYLKEADRTICIGPPSAARSYLAMDGILTAAIGSG